MARFDGKTVLITGGTNGIGLAGARRIAQEGGRVAVTGITAGRIDEARRILPNGSLVLRDDASEPDAGGALAEQVRFLGGLDGLWLNAGYADVRPVEQIDAGFFDRMMNANVRGPVLQIARLADQLKPGASVVLTSSTATYEGSPAASIYAATKGAMIAMGRSWANALGDRGIRVNVLVPGPIDTNFRDFMDEDFREGFETEVVSRVPLRRVGTAGEAAAVGLFLLSDESSFVTGSQYFVDGGLTML